MFKFKISTLCKKYLQFQVLEHVKMQVVGCFTSHPKEDQPDLCSVLGQLTMTCRFDAPP